MMEVWERLRTHLAAIDATYTSDNRQGIIEATKIDTKLTSEDGYE